MRALLFSRDGRLRNGWWLLVFVAAIALTRVAYKPLTGAIEAAGLGSTWLEPVPFLLVLLATWVCLRLRRETLAHVGFGLDRRWAAQFAVGTAGGVLAMLLITALIAAAGGVRFVVDPAASPATLAYGLYVFLFVALFEEALFRGFAFQRLIDGLGAWPALLGVGALFALGHFDNPGMEGATRLWASVDLLLGAVLFGLAWLRTRSLALPVGLHLGWNWAQGSLLGFGVSGYDQAGWLQPVFQDRPQWLTGGEFGPEASICAVFVDTLLVLLLWRWKGLVPARGTDRVGPATDVQPQGA